MSCLLFSGQSQYTTRRAKAQVPRLSGRCPAAHPLVRDFTLRLRLCRGGLRPRPFSRKRRVSGGRPAVCATAPRLPVISDLEFRCQSFLPAHPLPFEKTYALFKQSLPAPKPISGLQCRRRAGMLSSSRRGSERENTARRPMAAGLYFPQTRGRRIPPDRSGPAAGPLHLRAACAQACPGCPISLMTAPPVGLVCQTENKLSFWPFRSLPLSIRFHQQLQTLHRHADGGGGVLAHPLVQPGGLQDAARQ